MLGDIVCPNCVRWPSCFNPGESSHLAIDAALKDLVASGPFAPPRRRQPGASVLANADQSWTSQLLTRNVHVPGAAARIWMYDRWFGAGGFRRPRTGGTAS